jgi:short-subunit dehydrogenase
MKGLIDKKRFGPWALVTGASSGIGREFARQIAASGINVVLVARREALLNEVGRAIAKDFKVQYRTVVADLSQAGFLENLAKATDDLDIGLVVSNAGTGNPGEFLKIDREELESLLRLNTLAHLDIAHHFGQKLASRGRGGLLLVGAMGASNGLPYMANDGAAKAYVHSFGEALHVELKPLGVHVTVLPPGPTETPVIAKFGLSPDTMPMKPMKVEQCVFEGLKALEENRSMIIPGRLNRIMNAVVPGSVARGMMASMLRKTLANRPAKAQPQAKPQTQPQPKPR